MPDNSNKFSASSDVRIPAWINEAYFKRLLKREFREFRRILNLSIIPATPPGETYTSLLMRIVIDIELKGEKKGAVRYTIVKSHYAYALLPF